MDDYVTVSVRMPAKVAEWLRQQAAQSLRSLSAEVLYLLQREREAKQQPQK